MIITDICKQKHNPKRYSVYIDDEYCFGMDEVDILFYKLKIGGEIDQERYDFLFSTVLYDKAKERAIKLLSYKYYTEKEMRTRLGEDHDSVSIEKTIEFLKRYNYIDDAAYAQRFVNDKQNIKHYGEIRIRYELKQKGISSSIINEIYEQTDDDDEVENAVAALTKRYRNQTEFDFKETRRAYGFLMRRGFSGSVIKRALRCFTEEDLDYYED